MRGFPTEASGPPVRLPGMPDQPGIPRRAGSRPHAVGHVFHSRSPSREAIFQQLGVAAATGLLTWALGGGQAYWLCVPAVLLICAATTTRAATAAGVGLVLAAAAAPAAASGDSLPSPALAVLVPALSAAIALAMRERLESEREAMRRSALTDPLTGVANRRSFLSRIEYEISRHNRGRHPFGVVMLDLDGFKLLNDRFGHPAGDDLLRDVAVALGHVIRDQDTLARVGGDEFCVLAPETDDAGAERLTGRVEAAVARVAAGLDVLGASVGAAVFPQDGTTAPALLEAADQRLLGVKRDTGPGRGRRRAA